MSDEAATDGVVSDEAATDGVATDVFAERFDALLFDLDGVVYVGPDAVPHATESILQARRAGIHCAFITNNASRSPESVAAHLTDLGLEATVDEVITSPQAAVSLLPSFVPDGARVLVVGGHGIEVALTDRGYVPVHSLEEEPAAVMQGFSPDVSWRDLAEATFAVRSGLPWIATNPDLTFPTPRGVAPGNGALVRAVAETVGRGPDAVAGKPEPPLLIEAIARSGAQRPLMVGDRLDTDILAGTRVGIPSLLVFTGVTTMAELLGAVPAERPTYLAHDLRVLGSEYPTVECHPTQVTCRSATVRMVGQTLMIEDDGTTEGRWDAVRAAAALAWQCADTGVPVALGPAAEGLSAALTGTV